VAVNCRFEEATMQSFVAPRVLAFSLVVALAGCGGGDGASDSAPAASSSSTADADGALDPCALVTKTEADEALAAASTEERPGEANYPPTLVTCRYTAPRGAGLAVMTVMVRTGYSDAEAKVGFQGTREVGSAEAVAGLGDDAFWLGDQLYVLVGRRSLTVAGDLDRATAERLARQAVDRMK
jgi:hypothetical protein